ncbi:hypothetical protein [Dyadobacter sp. CY323]|uniref:hypothetical protein n=1 Tax=Dyadobacter sp. CY323 TaxID=2907302 RepID=UPI001F25C585|nr:hypothetical protein [Dyadobacter sp. CY323]MCE6992786.1 hypothetical protein [Dyadobacter sp. CY323]
MERNLYKTIVGIGHALLMTVIGSNLLAQSADVRYNNLPQQSSQLNISLKHEQFYNAWFDKQNAGVIVSNRTNDRVFVKLRFSVTLTCGEVRSQSLGYLSGDGIVLEARQTIGEAGYSDEKSTSIDAAFGVPASCRPDPNGKEKNVSIIRSVNYQVISVENLGEKDRQQAAVRAKQEEADRQSKLQLNRENEVYRGEIQLMIDELPGIEQGTFKSRLASIASQSVDSQKAAYLSLQRDLTEKSRRIAAEKAARRNESSSPSSSITGSNSRSSGGITVATTNGAASGSQTTNSSSTAKSNIVNGIDRSKLPELGKDFDGNHYRKGVNNEYQKISAQDYQALKREAAAKEAEAKQLAKQRAADQALAEWNKYQQEAEAKRKQQEESVRQVTQGLTDMAMNIMNDVNASRQRREEDARQTAEQKAIIDKANNEKANVLLKYYLEDARSGNEQAIIKVAEAYRLKQQEEKRENFLLEMVNKKYSSAATTILLVHYNDIMNGVKQECKAYKQRGKRYAIWTGILGICAYAGMTYGLSEKNYAPERETGAEIAYWTGGACMLVSPFLAIASACQFMGTNYRKQDKYINAKHVADQLEKRQKIKVSFSPVISPWNSSLGLSLRMKI